MCASHHVACMPYEMASEPCEAYVSFGVVCVLYDKVRVPRVAVIMSWGALYVLRSVSCESGNACAPFDVVRRYCLCVVFCLCNL